MKESIAGVSWLSGYRRLTGDGKVEGFNSDKAGANVLWQDIYLHFSTLHPGVEWVPGRMRKFMWLDEQVCANKMATGWNAPQGVENVHTLCAGKPKFDDRGNYISVKRLGTSLYRCIERCIKAEYYYYYRQNEDRRNNNNNMPYLYSAYHIMI